MKLIFCLILIFGFYYNSFAHEGATGIIAQRMEGFKNAQKNLKSIKQSLKTSDYKNIEILSKQLELWGSQMIEFFPAGSEASISNKSEASSDIWKNFEKFKELSKNFELASKKLGVLSQSKNDEEIKEGFNQLANTCSSCHKLFKN